MSYQAGYSRVQYPRSRKVPHGTLVTNHWIDQHAEPVGREYSFDGPKLIAEWLAAHPFNPAAPHTTTSLDMYATALLAQDPGDGIIFNYRLRDRAKREIYSTYGTPDPEIVMGMYWRTHPAGRPFNTREQMDAHSAGFYR